MTQQENELKPQCGDMVEIDTVYNKSFGYPYVFIQEEFSKNLFRVTIEPFGFDDEEMSEVYVSIRDIKRIILRDTRHESAELDALRDENERIRLQGIANGEEANRDNLVLCNKLIAEEKRHNLQSNEIEQRNDQLCWIARWIERGIYSDTTTPIAALKVIAHAPDMPWHSQVWDVDHKDYAEQFYKDFPKARPKNDTAGK